jgi:hypothetical protein
MLTEQTSIVGTNFRKGAKAHLDTLEEGTELTLEPEPTNKYDPHAVKVISGEMFVGYIPGDLSQMVSALIRTNKLVSVRIRAGTSIDINYEDKNRREDA